MWRDIRLCHTIAHNCCKKQQNCRVFTIHALVMPVLCGVSLHDGREWKDVGRWWNRICGCVLCSMIYRGFLVMLWTGYCVWRMTRQHLNVSVVSCSLFSGWKCWWEDACFLYIFETAPLNSTSFLAWPQFRSALPVATSAGCLIPSDPYFGCDEVDHIYPGENRWSGIRCPMVINIAV